ncbi:MAG: hypothetical protein HOM11_03765 [Methylococcales bacterium]|nr:hypothetical protein [Methylococcales bacterium]MBT7445924.1 hypothetical protein [Methylococcales bacterium]
MNYSNFKWATEWTLLLLAIAWGLTANGAEMMFAPEFLMQTCGEYFTESMSMVVALVGYDLYNR